MKVSALEGALLDYWVAQIERSAGVLVILRNGICFMDGGGPIRLFAPTLNWSQGGPIIERERIGTSGPGPMGPAFGDMNRAWVACIDTGSFPGIGAIGPTPLIAAMRAYVASKFGETVEGI